MNNIPELIEQLRNPTTRIYDEDTYIWKSADALESLQEGQDADHEQMSIMQHTNEISVKEIDRLQARVKELEEKSEFNERWISQTCETGQIKAERNQNTATDAVWVLTVSPLPEPPE